VKLDERRDRAFYREWVDLTDGQFDAIDAAFDVIETDPRAGELYRAEQEHLISKEADHCLAADKGELAGLFDGRVHVFALAVLLGGLPRLVKGYEFLHMDPKVLRRTLRDIPIWMNVCKNVYGYWGLAEYGWLVNHFRMKLFGFGSLQFIRNRLPAFGIDDVPGMNVLEIHIPEGTDLSAESVDASLREALAFHEKHFGIRPERFICESWLLDPALQELIPGSRIAAFGARFTRTGTCGDEGQTVQRTFGFDVKDYRLGPRKTTLQRAVANWLDNGGRCCQGIGWIAAEPYRSQN